MLSVGISCRMSSGQQVSTFQQFLRSFDDIRHVLWHLYVVRFPEMPLSTFEGAIPCPVDRLQQSQRSSKKHAVIETQLRQHLGLTDMPQLTLIRCASEGTRRAKLADRAAFGDVQLQYEWFNWMEGAL